MPVEVYPIVLLTGLALGVAGWQIARCARSPDVIWDKKVCIFATQTDSQNNPTPWNNIEQGTQYKLWNIGVRIS